MEEEIWKPVPEYEEKYQASDIGRVKSLNYKRTGKEGILKPVKQSDGYLAVMLTRKVRKYVHHLVAELFVPNPENKPYIDHIDGNKLNNNASNLHWVTHKENMNNPISRKRMSESHIGLFAGENNPMYGKHPSEETRKKMRNAKTLKPVICLKDDQIIKIYDAMHDVMKDGFYVQNVCKCCKGRYKSHKGFSWMYLSDYEKRQG